MTLLYSSGRTTGEATSRSLGGEPSSRGLRDANHSTSQKLRNAGPSIAVMPLTNISADPENEYFCDGMAEELLNALAKVEGLKVAARTSAFSFKGRNVPIEEIGRALNVNSVLEGSVRRVGNRLRISVQLLSVADGFHLWSESYDREMKDVFDIQEEITQAIVSALEMKLLGEKKAVVLKRYCENTDAYELYLKGRYFFNQYKDEAFVKAVEYYERAIELEPEYAPAYASLAVCQIFRWYYGYLSPGEAVFQWKAAMNRALEIDDDLAEAQLALALDRFLYEWNWKETEQAFRRAIELNPNYADLRWAFGAFLMVIKRFDEAIRQGRRALELDPLSLGVKFQVGWIFLFSNRAKDAQKQIEQMMEIEPRFHAAHRLIGASYLISEMYPEALDAYQKSVDLGGGQVALSLLGCCYGYLGKREEALAIVNQFLEMRNNQYVPAAHIARIYLAMGENDLGFEWLERGYEQRDGEMVFFGVLSGKIYRQGTFQKDPRLAELLQRMGLPAVNSER